MTTARSLRGPFDYRLPEELRAAVQVGSMLVVPFGRRQVLGVVVGLAERSQIAGDRLVSPLRALEHGVPPDLVELAGWIAREYCSTPARALRRHRRGASLPAAPRRALCRVEEAAHRPGAHLRGPTLGRLRPGRGALPGHRRRGARRLLQARGRSPL